MTATETNKNNDLKTNISNHNNCNIQKPTLLCNPSNPEEVIELTENFYINNNNKKRHNLKIQVQLNDKCIYFRRETPDYDQITEQLIYLEDIVGSHCGAKLKKRARGGLSTCNRLSDINEEQHQSESYPDQEQKDTSAYLYIYAYVKKEKPLQRIRTVRILCFRSFLKYEENLKVAECWRTAIKVNKNLKVLISMDIKPLLILLNPKSGKCKGRVIFQKQMYPVLKEAEVQYELVVTTHANFARELMKQSKDIVEKYSGIIVASGDGLLFEVINGIFERPDWRILARKLPVGIVPCGSGNGLAKTIAYLYNEPYEPKPIVNATLTCVSGCSAPMDIVRVQLKAHGNLTEMYSFLSVGWGIIADIDIESEKLRSIGSPRFTLWSIHRLLYLRTYKGKVSYLLWRKKENSSKAEVQLKNKSGQGQTAEIKQPSILKRFHDAEDDELEEFVDAMGDDNILSDGDEFSDIISHRTNVGSWHSAISRRTAYYSIADQSLRSNCSATKNILSKIEQVNAEYDTRSLQSSLPPFDSPLNEDWISEKGEFVLVQAAYTTHLASDCLFAPDSRLNDGIIYLVIIRAGISRSQLLHFLLNMSSGTHLVEAPTSHIQVIPVTAFRIEPKDDEGIITVDGENVGYGAIQGEIFPGLLKVMVPNTPKALD